MKLFIYILFTSIMYSPLQAGIPSLMQEYRDLFTQNRLDEIKLSYEANSNNDIKIIHFQFLKSQAINSFHVILRKDMENINIPLEVNNIDKRHYTVQVKIPIAEFHKYRIKVTANSKTVPYVREGFIKEYTETYNKKPEIPEYLQYNYGNHNLSHIPIRTASNN